MRIDLAQYFAKPHSAAQLAFALDLLQRVDALVEDAVAAGAFSWAEDPDTGSGISGAKGGDGDGGFRLPSSKTGAPNSSHREARAVDVYDPGNRLDIWLNGFEDGQGGNTKLAEHDLYREDPSATESWCHLTTRAPHSGHRTFMP